MNTLDIICYRRKPLLIQKLLGGLGNQMFEYAFAYGFTRRTGQPAAIDSTFYMREMEGTTPRAYELPLFNISLPQLVRNRLMMRLLWGGVSTLPERIVTKGVRTLSGLRYDGRARAEGRSDFGYYPELQSPVDCPTAITGYFQSPRYFDDFRQELLQEFTPVQPLSENASKYAGLIDEASESVSVHVRRGDYLRYSDTFVILSDEYYRRALARLRSELGAERAKDLRIYLFTDSPADAAQLFAHENVTLVQGNTGSRSYEDMLLMSRCRHHIIANSSFSWWGAWLGSADGLTIAPKDWMVDKRINDTKQIYPQGWIVI